MMVDYANVVLDRLKNDYAGALALGREALEMFRQRYGENHYMVSATQAEIARLYVDLGDYTQAEAYIQDNLKQHQTPLFVGLGSYANMRTIKGDYQAVENAISEMTVLAQSPDAKPWLLANVHHTQSFLAYRQGDYAQALAHSEKAFDMLPNDASASYNRARHSARCLNKLGQTKRAEALLHAEIERLRKTERVFDLARLKSLLGESLTAQRRFAEAEIVLIEAYEKGKTRVLTQQYDLVETRRRLVQLYRAWGKEAEARKYE
jgi:tetratricopeptide (TPR) repeat protein